MRTAIYFGIVGFLFYIGFTNLDGNNWEVVDLPSIVTNVIEEERIVLPLEEWQANLIGTWNYSYIDEMDDVMEGVVEYMDDGTYVKQIEILTWHSSGEIEEVNGTTKGRWEIKDNAWVEHKEECDIYYKKDWFDPCTQYLPEPMIFGSFFNKGVRYKVLSFSSDKIEIRAKRNPHTAILKRRN